VIRHQRVVEPSLDGIGKRVYTRYMASRNATTAAAEIASQCACFSVRKAARAVTQLYDKTLEPSGLRVTQFTLLVALSLSEQTLSQVAERLVMDRTTLTRNLAPLERDGLVKRERGPDRRERSLRLTSAGRRALEQTLPFWRRAQARVVTAIGQDAWHGLRGGLHAFVTAMRDIPLDA
jgi:DNA-binding MarR family transcriptional regulator